MFKKNLTSDQPAQEFFSSYEEKQLLDILMRHIVAGEQKEAESLVKSTPKLLLMRNDVIDLSGRKFYQVTAFQYTLWAFDRNMWEMLLSYLPKEEAQKQLNYHQKKGINIQLTDKKIINEKHYNFSEIIDALRNYVNKFQHNHAGEWMNVVIKNEGALVNLWNNVGKAQKNMPANIANQYCHPERSFSPPPKFKDQILPRNLTVFYEKNPKYFFDLPLGLEGAVFRNNYSNAGFWWWSTEVGKSRPGENDLKAMEALRVVRTAELNILKEQLLLSTHNSLSIIKKSY